MVQGYFKDVSGEFQGFSKKASDTFYLTCVFFEFRISCEKQISLTPIVCLFAKISQEMEPLNLSRLPLVTQHFLNNYDMSVAPELTPADVFARIMRAKKPNSSVPGDLPKKLVQQCADILAIPASLIFNQITQTAVFPDAWKIEYQIPIPKVFPPECEDDLRNIAKTAFLSKIYESFVGSWLLPIIKPYLDPGQCGLKGLSITHYLIKLLNFIHSTLDLKKPHSVLAACVDISKAFNRIDHTLVIQDLYDMHTPAWLLNIVISYLSGRSMVQVVPVRAIFGKITTW